MKRILIADDDPSILDGLSTLLSRSYEVVAARNGEDLLAELERRAFDLVLLDLRMLLLFVPFAAAQAAAGVLGLAFVVFLVLGLATVDNLAI